LNFKKIWGGDGFVWKYLEGAFNNCPNFTRCDIGNWDISAVTNTHAMFWRAYLADPITTNWNTSNITDMGYMFESATSANPDTSNWNMSKVTNTVDMFWGATSANPDTSNWDTSAIIDMNHWCSFSEPGYIWLEHIECNQHGGHVYWCN
jgi:surface protein